MFAITGAAQTPTHVVISQVYGGGGNSGSTYTNDFVELFNPTTSPQTLTGYSVQYASSTGTSYQATPLPGTITLQPGQFYLVQEAQGSGGTTALPTPDASGTIAMSATAGKIALVNSATALNGSSGCPTAAQGVVDYVGFGAANCFLGTGPTATLANATAAIRTNLCVDNQNNAVDFSTGAANPHNTGSTLAPCNPTGPGQIAAAGLANPASVNQNNPTLLTVTVIPGTNPASAGISVAADLSNIGGSSTQPFFDDGTNGDLTAGDNIFSYSFTPSLAGTFSLPVTVADTQMRSAKTTIALTVIIPPPTISIQQIQSAKPSPYVTQKVTTSGIVIGVKSSGFYLEAKNASTTATTPQGILVYTGSTSKPSYITVGAEVQVSGTVATYPATGLTPSTEIDSPTFTLLSSGNPLPPAVTITQAMDSPSGGIYQFTRLEGMRVAIDSLTTTSGTDASLTESTETNTSNGLFYGVVTGVPRPFREPGVGITDTAYGPLPAGVPVWDSNPELIYIDSKSFRGTGIDLTSNATVTGLSGVMDFSYGAPEILLDATNNPTVTGLMTAQPLPVQTSGEFTIASMNLERFYNDVSDQDNPGSSAVTVTTEAYQRRLNKASLAIRNVLNTPDIIGTQEVENLAVLTDLAKKVSADAVAAGQPDPLYVPYLFLGNDISAINTGLLVKSTKVDTVRVEQFGLDTTFTNSGGSQATLNDRTPLVAHLGIKRGSGTDYPLTMIVVHQRSLINVDDPTSTGATVRLKREAQAEFLAKLIQGYQAAGEHVVAVGDYNSFEFSDGFVDVLGVTRGNPVPASQVVTPPVAGLANPPLVDLVTLLPAEQRQSYVETGSAQVLDHVVVTSDLVPQMTRLAYAHYDADFPLVYLNDATRPERVSDHDAPVAYFSIPAVQGTVQVTASATLIKVSNGYQATVTLKNTGAGTAQNVVLTGAVLGAASGSPLPYAVGDIQPGASATATILFPASAGNPGAAAVEKFTGTYTGGAFTTSLRAVIPAN
ncbi:MAG: lamin tail domain-containing protein [Edaphobacter sp.]|uniref:lamin tail domain-containing protein n=1 Tax=Edaphobacter sp. TaxID=1934404 RepID=UPI00239C8B9A|nr:lamin tail domain-containing protein [Edaphobacter sp.]MDE1176704.1 lamin tail domain-containing protein [Edaphobacter sp.]